MGTCHKPGLQEIGPRTWLYSDPARPFRKCVIERDQQVVWPALAVDGTGFLVPLGECEVFIVYKRTKRPKAVFYKTHGGLLSAVAIAQAILDGKPIPEERKEDD